jgi:hypothetical protein
MKKEVANWTAADIIRAREGRYKGWNDLTTEGALRWSLVKHAHPLNEIHPKCPWCATERRALDALHCATRSKGEPWWEQFIANHHKELRTMVAPHCGFCWTDVRVSLPDGRWWIARTFDQTERGIRENGEPQWSAERLRSREQEEMNKEFSDRHGKGLVRKSRIYSKGWRSR